MRLKPMKQNSLPLTLIVAIALFAWIWPAISNAQLLVNCPGDSLQAAVNAAVSGVTIDVTGSCNEDVFIGENKEGLTLDGNGTATINGPSATTPTVQIRGRGITLTGFTISGGSTGILVQRGGTAIVSNNDIKTTGVRGILVNQQSFAIIINNLIQSHPNEGVLINENSAARIGFLSGTDTVAQPNTIQNNGTHGIRVTRSSNARIVGNKITDNRDHGIFVQRVSQSDISANNINNNGGDGVFVFQNSVVNLGRDTGAGIFDLPNDTTANNTGFGIRCRQNSVADGRLGTLNGVAGATSFTGSCIDTLIP